MKTSKDTTTVYCEQCKTQYFNYYFSCPVCMTDNKNQVQIAEICSKCNLENSVNALYCKSCGEKLFKETKVIILKCEVCGKEYDSSFSFCSIDGGKIIKEKKIIQNIPKTIEKPNYNAPIYIGGMPVLNFIPWAIWLIGRRMYDWDWFPSFFIALAASAMIHYLLYESRKK